MRVPIEDPNKRTEFKTPEQALTAVRLIWVALLVGQVIFFGSAMFIGRSGAMATLPASTTSVLFYVAVGLLVVVTPLAYVLRAKVRGSDRPVPFEKFVSSTVVFHGMMEGVSMVGLVVMLLSGTLIPAIIVPLIAVGVMAVNFPTGADLQK